MASLREPVSLGEKQTIIGQGYISSDLYQVQKDAVHGFLFSLQLSSSKNFMTCEDLSVLFSDDVALTLGQLMDPTGCTMYF